MSEDSADSIIEELEKTFEKVEEGDTIEGSHSEGTPGVDNKAEPWSPGDHTSEESIPNASSRPDCPDLQTGINTRSDMDCPDQPTPRITTRMVMFSYKKDKATGHVIQCMLENKFPGKAYQIEQEEPGKIYLYFNEEIDVLQVEENLGGSLIQVTPLDAPCNREDCTAVNIQQVGIDVSGITPSDIENQMSIIRLYLKNPARSGGGTIEDVFFRKDTGQFTVTFAEAAVAQNVREKHGTGPFELDRGKWQISELKPAVPAPLVLCDTEPTRLIFRGLPANTTGDVFERYLQKWKPGPPNNVEFAMEPGVAMVEFQNEVDYSEFSCLVAQRPFLGTMICVQRVPSLRSIQIHCCPESDDWIKLHYEDDDPGIVVNLRHGGSFVIVTFHTREQALRSLQRAPSEGGRGWTNYVRPYFETFGQMAPSHDPMQPPVVCPNPELYKANIEIMRLIKRYPQLRICIESEMERQNTRLVWLRDDDQPIKMECTLTNVVKDAKKKVSTWCVDAMGHMRKACQFYTVLCSNVPTTATTEVITEALGKLPEVDPAMLIVHDLDKQRKTARATFRFYTETFVPKWTITIHQAEVLCELADMEGRRTSTREGETRTIVFDNLPTCLGPVMSTLLTNLVENKARYGGGPVERVHYDHGRNRATVLLRDADDAEEFIDKNQRLAVGEHQVAVSLAEYNMPNPDRSYALKIVNSREVVQCHEIELYIEDKVPNFKLQFDHLDTKDTVVICDDHRGIGEILRQHRLEPFTWNRNRLTLEELRTATIPIRVASPSPVVAIVQDVPVDISDEEVVKYLECSGCKVNTIEKSQNLENRLVCFNEEPDFARLWLRTVRLPLRGHLMTVQRVPLPDSVEILNATGISQKVLDLYFSNSSRSGGGQIVDIDMSPGGYFATIKFASNEVLRRVLSRQHIIQNKQLDVKVYYPGFGSGRDLLPDSPHPGTIDEDELATPGRIVKIRVDPQQLNRILVSVNCKENISAALFGIGGEVLWQDQDECIRVAYAQDITDVRWKNWISLVRDVIKQVVEEYFSNSDL